MPTLGLAAPDYSFSGTRGTLRLLYENEDESRTSPTIEDRKQETTTFRQQLEIGGKGWFYHPDLLRFSYALQPEWQQENTVATGGFRRDDDNKFLGYRIDSTFFQQKPHSLRIYMTQTRNVFDSDLSPDNVTESTINRAVWRINNAVFPTSITYEHNDKDFQDFFDSQDTSDILRLETRHRTDKSLSLLTSESTRQKREITKASFAVDRFLVNFSNTYDFTKHSRLTSSLYGIDSSSELFDSKSYIASERLIVRHTPNFRTNYEARFERRENVDFTSTTALLSGGFVHQLYENLTTTFETYVSDDNVGDGNIKVYEHDLDFRYTRRIPAGRLNIRTGYAYRREDNRVSAQIAQVFNESVVLAGSEASFLARSNIDADSIVITDSTEAIVFAAGIDYVVSVVGDSVSIARTLFSAITDGQEVLVDYVFVPRAPFESARTEARFGASLRLWRVLRLYYNSSRAEEKLLSGRRPADLADDKIRRLGGELHWRWSTTGAEYEDHDTVRTPFTRRRFYQRFTFRPKARLSAGLFADYTETLLTDTAVRTISRNLGASFRWSFARWGDWELRAFSRDIDGESQSMNSAGVISRLNLRYGAWIGSVRYETLDEDDDLTLQTRDRQLLSVLVQRAFY